MKTANGTDYVRRMVDRKGNEERYPLHVTQTWLGWLAGKMRQHGLTLLSKGARDGVASSKTRDLLIGGAYADRWAALWAVFWGCSSGCTLGWPLGCTLGWSQG